MGDVIRHAAFIPQAPDDLRRLHEPDYALLMDDGLDAPELSAASPSSLDVSGPVVDITAHPDHRDQLLEEALASWIQAERFRSLVLKNPFASTYPAVSEAYEKKRAALDRLSSEDRELIRLRVVANISIV